MKFPTLASGLAAVFVPACATVPLNLDLPAPAVVHDVRVEVTGVLRHGGIGGGVAGFRGVATNLGEETLSFCTVTLELLDPTGAKIGNAMAATQHLASGVPWKFDAYNAGTIRTTLDRVTIADVRTDKSLFAGMSTGGGDKRAKRAEARSGAPSAEQSPKVPPADRYSLEVVSAEEIDGRVRIRVTTNIPGTVEVMAVVELAGQALDDTFIGKDERMTINSGVGEVVLDTAHLPSGRYEAQASFYPRWGLKDEVAKRSGADAELQARVPLWLTGSGESADAAEKRDAGQRWVMENVIEGRKYDAREWARFGRSDSVTITRYNPEIIKGYYFPDIDMTVFVNTLKGEVSFWRMGRASY